MMNDTLLQALNAAWEQMTLRLFCDRTNLIYDYLGTLGEDRFDFLPLPEEIRRGFPNNKGYSTGMEDSMINAGMAMEICILRAELFPEKAGECAEFAGKLFRGMELCATVHGRNGYIVRSVSHRDGKSCYPCSSRDQMTFWIWGLWRYFHSSFPTEGERSRIRELSVMLAERAENETIPENDYCILTLDGVPDPLNKMDYVQSHEILRLPMFDLAAFALSGERHWKECYDRRIKRALVMAAEPRKWWNHFELSQFLLSLSLCHALDPRPELVRIARTIASITEEKLRTEFLPRLEQWTGDWMFPAICWKDSDNIILQKRTDGSVIGADGRLDLRFRQRAGFSDRMDLVRIPGNLMAGVLLAPEYAPDHALRTRFLNDFRLPDYSRTCTCSPINMLLAALLLLKSNRSGGR